MKYMNQRVFDAFALRTVIAKVTNETGINYSNVISEYMETYDGDTLFLSQASTVADQLIENWSNLNVNQKVTLAQNLIQVRADLDDEMNKRSSFSKIFAGPALIKSHSNSENRVFQSMKNISQMLDSL